MPKNSFKDVAILAAREAAKVHLKYFRRNFRVKQKSSSFDFLTVADTEAETKAVAAIRRYFPGHNIFAEEKKYKKTSSPYCWIIDPLDGTNNFTFRLPIFCVSIALARDSEIITGVIYDATRKELFWAEKGKGAYLNGERIKVSAAKRLDQSLLITGFYYDRGNRTLDNLNKIRKFFKQRIVGLRRLGAAALDLCYVACGRATGFWEFKLSPWDFAAGKLLIEEAGGRVTGLKGEPVRLRTAYIVASNGRIHKKMLEVLR